MKSIINRGMNEYRTNLLFFQDKITIIGLTLRPQKSSLVKKKKIPARLRNKKYYK